jgi:hypothetical protein
MPPDPEHEDDRLALLERLKQASTTSSLTLLSIVQGVALADLVGVVADQYQQFHLLQWLLLGGNFLFILAAWNQILMDTVTWVNLPSVTRSFIPFLLGALEFSSITHSSIIPRPGRSVQPHWSSYPLSGLSW